MSRPFDMDTLNDITFRLIEKSFYLIGCLPRQRARQLSDRLGRLWFLADGRHRRVALANLTRAFGREKSDRDIRLIAKRVFGNIVQVVFEVGWGLHQSPEDLGRYIKINGLDNIPATAREGGGALILTGHVGNWELMPLAACMTGHTANILYRPMDFAPLDRFFAKTRTRFGLKLIPKDASLLRVLRTLKRGEAVAMLLDQNVGLHKGVMVDFFGRRASTSYGLAYIALKTEAPVLPFFVVRNQNGFTAEIGPIIPLVKTGDLQKDLEENTQRYTDALEAIIRRHPDQWFWVHRRWKTRPYTPWPRTSHA